ncbi:hypothetical protein ERO13_A10G195350v2 [Gossypium hirsutum]|uniref:Uncharacterized protein n=2 Tax=Gossypium TaxID=3633 RepID=A0A5D2XPE6_GOSMU|nr:hypothetical protein ERO13_A10G195350v2 [Gossypium hirsutum]TYI07524.1 hypothetical protein ES332_A10G233400v1 [Gossypium tomentosum]TYI07525.1 hypothetical protein ES332_A10G233400v1 [Gossypium tomentosum]TYJ15905.1 hypothetical protein E1A91_A10G214200v1 [Gossypium mustelinum]TYJ15906.1 hypothetical protein E1A91_A10G214200v1 [Gossypium mustelinum]
MSFKLHFLCMSIWGKEENIFGHCCFSLKLKLVDEVKNRSSISCGKEKITE